MSDFSIRHYDPADYPMISEWREQREQHAVPELMLPKCGVICERNGTPVASLFLHMSNSNGMCMAEHAASVPGLTLKVARQAFQHCVACLKQIAAELGYHTMAIYTHPGIARILQSEGFMSVESNLVQMLAPTKEVPNG
jgi:hypothetical protein